MVPDKIVMDQGKLSDETATLDILFNHVQGERYMFKKKLKGVKSEIPGYCFKVDGITYYIYTADNEYQMYNQSVAGLQDLLESSCTNGVFLYCRDTGKIFRLYTNPTELYSYKWIRFMEGTEQDLLKRLFPSYVAPKIYEDNVYVNINKLLAKCEDARARNRMCAILEQLNDDSKVVVDRYES